MKKSTITILTLLLIMLGQVQAQDEPTEQEQTQKSKSKMSLQFQAGIARESRGSMDGYFWSSNFFLPVIKGVIVSPSFSQFTYVPTLDDQKIYRGSSDGQKISIREGEFKTIKKGSIFSSVMSSMK